MKKLDILIIRSFVGPFIVTFFVALFVLVMQFFWLYMDDLIGKGLSIWMILQLLVLTSPTVVPLALPLSVLLASIMTFGNMGENFELVAIKSSGISLLRFMRPLLVFIIFIGGLAFLFNNNVIPVANLKALSLLYDLRNLKPTLNVRPGQFNNEIQNYSIKVGSKDKDDHTIRDVIIYDHSDYEGNDKIILAKEGEMMSSPDRQYLIFKLKDGWRYEEGFRNGQHDSTQTRMHFAEWDKIFDLSSFRFTRTNEDLFKNAEQMMNITQLKQSIDSMNRYSARISDNVGSVVVPYVSLSNGSSDSAALAKKMKKDTVKASKYSITFLRLVPDSLRAKTMQLVNNNIRNLKSQLSMKALENKVPTENTRKFKVEYYRKFTLSFACVLLFLIGAPLGAIIKKGGLGMPLVIAIILFIVFHIITITGEKLAKAGSVVPWVGMWMATAMLLPLAIWLISRARNDSQIFSKEWYIRMLRRIQKWFLFKGDNVSKKTVQHT